MNVIERDRRGNKRTFSIEEYVEGICKDSPLTTARVLSRVVGVLAEKHPECIKEILPDVELE